METKPTKMVIVIRKDLKMRRGKEIAQGAHAAMGWVMQRLWSKWQDDEKVGADAFSQAELDWIQGKFRKITLQVDSEQELLNLHKAAKEAGLTSHIIQDAGLTEFDGVPTYTALAIGPDYDEKVDPITSHLKPY